VVRLLPLASLAPVRGSMRSRKLPRACSVPETDNQAPNRVWTVGFNRMEPRTGASEASESKRTTHRARGNHLPVSNDEPAPVSVRLGSRTYERIEGLITKFGGSNSHMAIRCAEMSVPAAIGVGELLFETLAYSPRIELSCGEGSVRGICG